MIESELGSFNFGFDVRDLNDKNDFIEIGMKQFGLQAGLLVNELGNYSFTLTISKFYPNESKSQESQIEQSELHKQAVGY